MIIEGRNALCEALKSDVTIEKVLIMEGAPNAGSVISLCKEKKVMYKMADRKVLDRFSPDGSHRGFIGFATEFKYFDIEEILKNDNMLLLLLDGIEDPHNLGAIIRVAECAGADGIVIPKRRSCGVTDTVLKISSGAASHVKVAKVNNLNDLIRDLKERGVTVLCADMDGDSIYKTDLKGNLAIVIGGEGEGVHALTKKLCDGVIALPQRGKVNSLNASVAAGIVLYECLRQRGV